jgi:2-polyprenyl-6-methoxyphenol hydroxylase-like FAD-dependent oxidoreductase
MRQSTDQPQGLAEADRVRAVEHADCCIVGGGPGGAVLALLLARQGVAVTLLEAHGDFNRDFRGDALQPAVLDVLGQMGLADRVLAIAIARLPVFAVHTRTETVPLDDVGHLRTPYRFITMVPQARFLDLIVSEAQRCPSFQLVMGARVEALVRDDDGHVRGVRYRAKRGWAEIRTQLVVGADGRSSRLRSLASLEPVSTASPVDYLWFRVPRSAADPAGGVYLGDGGWAVLLNRGAEWQVGYSLKKGSYAELRAQGLNALRRSVELRVPWLADRTDSLCDWRRTSLLAVEVCRLRRWYCPGLLMIGDAAHTMSPVGAVGISEAIQDAVVASNILGPRLRAGCVREKDLAAVQRRREWPVRIVQVNQRLMQKWFMATRHGAPAERVPIVLRAKARIPFLRDLTARVFGLGVWPPRLNPASVCGPVELVRRPDQSIQVPISSQTRVATP